MFSLSANQGGTQKTSRPIPLAFPEWKWEHKPMDFVSGLPRSDNNHDAI